MQLFILRQREYIYTFYVKLYSFGTVSILPGFLQFLSWSRAMVHMKTAPCRKLIGVEAMKIQFLPAPFHKLGTNHKQNYHLSSFYQKKIQNGFSSTKELNTFQGSFGTRDGENKGQEKQRNMIEFELKNRGLKTIENQSLLFGWAQEIHMNGNI